jgi:uncharacterized protein (TIGR03435 family)
MGHRRIRVIKTFLAGIALLAASGIVTPSRAQSTDWQTAAGGKMAFDVASVKQGEFVLPSFPLDGGDAFTATGGRFIANFPLVNLMMFAYKFYPSPGQRDALNKQLPDWAHFPSVRFTIEGKAPINNPTKDQFRLMVQSLLADRFKLAVHFETRESSIFALTLVNPGKLGPTLRPHDSGAPCDVAEGGPAVTGGSDVFPALCGAFGARPAPDGMYMQLGSRNTTLPLIAQWIAATGNATLPVVDRTGLSSAYDFTMEVFGTGIGAISGTAQLQAKPGDPTGPTFIDSLRDQLGLKLEPAKGPVQFLIVDHVERPTEN